MEGSLTRKELRQMYNRGEHVIRRWLVDAGITHSKSLTPAELQIFFSKVGDPKRAR